MQVYDFWGNYLHYPKEPTWRLKLYTDAATTMNLPAIGHHLNPDCTLVRIELEMD
jgi:hypothetical protein